MEAIKYSKKGEEIGKVTLPQHLFDAEVNKAVLHEVVTLYLRNQRQGTASVKGRSDIHGSTRKLYRQKGTGRARAGSVKSPIRVGGGVAFGPRPKDWYKAIPKKKKRIALKSALSSKKEHVAVIEDIEMSEPNTKQFQTILGATNMPYERCLFIMTDNDQNLVRSISNIKNVSSIRAEDLNAFEVLHSSDLLITEKALEKMIEVFK
ncbi:MAG TPA: 50S ribosomal protein L4 [Candidatus Cloacimonetes bacterium]|nr:50S ribosomal protein L4 [Candidatus Cloacimonadota bacterium]HEX37876.1 50S ribosomal protein L4 [Candidatus Cloacimonadota bacterium]